MVVGNPLPYLSEKKGSTMYTTTFLYYCFPLLSGFCQISVFYRCVLCVRTHCNGSFFIWWPRILLGPLQTSLSFWLGSFWLFFPLNSRAFYQLIVCYLGCCIHRTLYDTDDFTSHENRFFTWHLLCLYGMKFSEYKEKCLLKLYNQITGGNTLQLAPYNTIIRKSPIAFSRVFEAL